MTSKLKFCLLSVALNLVPAAAMSHDLAPGLYQVDVRVELPNLIYAATTLSKRVCITKEMTAGHDAFEILSETPLANCPREPICTDGKRVGFQVRCPGRAAAFANASFKISDDQFTGNISMNMGGKNMTVIERQIGRRVGDCP